MAEETPTKVIREEVKKGVEKVSGEVTAPLKSFLPSLIAGIPTADSFLKVAKSLVPKKDPNAGKMTPGEVEDARKKDRLFGEQTVLLERIAGGIGDMAKGFLNATAKAGGMGLGVIAGLIAAPVITLVNFFKSLTVEFKFLVGLTKKIASGKMFAPLRFVFGIFETGFKQLLGLARFGLNVALAPARIFFGFFPQIGAAFSGLTNFIMTVVKGAKFGEFFAFIGNTVMRAVNFVKGMFTPVINFFKTLTTVSGAATGAFSGIARFAAGFGQILGKIFLPITILMSAFDFITGFIDGYKTDGILGGLEGGLSKLFGNLIGMPLDLLKSAVGWIAGVFGFDGVKDALSKFSFKDLIGDLIGGIFDGVDGVFAFLGDLFDFSDLSMFGIFQKLVDIVFLPLNLAINFVKGLFGFGDEEEPFSLGAFIGETVTAVINWFKTLFSNPVEALKQLWTTITGGYDSLFSLISWPIDAAINWIMGLFGWSDPEGEPFSLWGTIKSALNSVWEWLAGLFDFDLGSAIEGLLPSWTPGWVRRALGLGGGDDSDEDEDPRVANERRRAELEREMQEARDRIQRSESGENVYLGLDSSGRARDSVELLRMQQELNELGPTPDDNTNDGKIHFGRLSDGNFYYFRMRNGRITPLDDQGRAEQLYNAQNNVDDAAFERGQGGNTVIVRQGDSPIVTGGGGRSKQVVPIADNSTNNWNRSEF